MIAVWLFVALFPDGLDTAAPIVTTPFAEVVASGTATPANHVSKSSLLVNNVTLSDFVTELVTAMDILR